MFARTLVLIGNFCWRKSTSHDYQHKAKEKLELIRQQLQERVEAVVGVFANVLPFFADESPEAQWSQVKQILQAGGRVDHLLSECDAINAYRGNNHFPYA